MDFTNPKLRIRLNRPQALNALTVSLLQEMQAALDAIQRDDTIGIVILTGAGSNRLPHPYCF